MIVGAMAWWLQHLLVLAAVAGCVFVIARQAIKTLRGHGKLGACCAKGCEPTKTQPAERIVFLPSDMLRVSKR